MLSAWKTVKLGDLFEFKNGVNADKSAYGTGVPFINIMDIFRNDVLTQDNVQGKVNIPSKVLGDNSAIYGDVFFNRTSETPDEIAFSSIYMGSEKITFGGFVIRGRPVTNQLVPDYIKYCFKAPTFRKEIIRRGQGAVRGNIGQKDLQKVELRIPGIPEQKRIVSVLETWDTYLGMLDKKIELKQKVDRGLKKRLLSGSSHIKDSFDEWSNVKLGSISKMSSGGTPKSTVPKYYGGSIPWVSIADMTSNGKVIYKTIRNLTDDGLKNSAARIYPKGTILYAMYASIGECSIAGVEMCSSQAILGITPDASMLNSLFLYHYLRYMKDEIKLKGQHGTQANLNAGMVRDFNIYLPSIDEQKEIVNILDAADRELDYLIVQRNMVISQKKYLVDNLVNGEIQTPEDLTTLAKEASYA